MGRGSRRSSIGRRMFAVAGVMGLGMVGACAALAIEPVTRGTVGPGSVAVRASLGGRPATELELPPLGALSARTHRSPLKLSATVQQLDVQELQRLLAGSDPEGALRRSITQDVEPLLRAFVVRTLIFSGVVGGLLGAVVPRRRPTLVVAGITGGVAGAALVLGLTWTTFDAGAFEAPQFVGPLEEAPHVLQTIQRHVDSFEDVRGRVDILSRQLTNLYQAASAEPQPGPTDTAILHVSDIHLNPLGLEFASRLAREFGTRAIVDTGDLTSFGLPVEARIGDILRTMPVPYYFVPGNHDSPEVRTAMAGVANVTVLDGQFVEIGGVRVLGVADPTFTADNKTSPGEAKDAKTQEAPIVAQLVQELGPDVLAVHDPVLGAEAAGAVPLVIQGHTHRRRSELRSGTRFLTVGTSGASGLGAFTVSTALAYEAEVLHFRGGQLVAVDYVSLAGVEGSFRVDREVVPRVPAA